MRVALFGGSFNPPHVAHQLVALTVLETEPVDELWWIPTFAHPFDKHLAPFADRLAMCQRAAAALGPRVKVSDVEERLGGESRTLRTVKTLKGDHPGAEFAIVIGADLEAEIASWYGAAELRALVRFIVIGRAGHGDGGVLAMPPVSSTDVRSRLASGQPVDRLVPRAVLDYIRDRTLYGSADE